MALTFVFGKGNLGVPNFDTWILRFLYGDQFEGRLSNLKINWLWTLGNLETWIEVVLYGQGLTP